MKKFENNQNYTKWEIYPMHLEYSSQVVKIIAPLKGNDAVHMMEVGGVLLQN